MVKKVNKAQTTFGGADWSFLDLGDVDPSNYSNTAGYVVVVNQAEDGLELVAAPGGSPVAMTDLTDGPGTYAGASEGDILEKASGNTLRWVTPPPAPDPHPTELVNNFTDWLSTYAGENGKLLKVSGTSIVATDSAADLPAFTVDQATDVPTFAGGSGDALKVVRVNAAGNALEFVDPQVAVDPSQIALHDLDQMPAFQPGKFLQSGSTVGEGLQYVSAPGVTIFTGLSDTPTLAQMQANPGYLLHVGAGGAVELVAPAAQATFTSLGETPANFTGAHGKLVAVHATNNELEFIDPPKEPILVAASDEETVLTTGVTKVRFRMPYSMTVGEVRASLGTVSSSGVVTVDINKNGTSILGTKLTVDANEKSSVTATTAATITTPLLVDDDEITVDIDGAGAGAAGLKVTLVPA